MCPINWKVQKHPVKNNFTDRFNEASRKYIHIKIKTERMELNKSIVYGENTSLNFCIVLLKLFSRSFQKVVSSKSKVDSGFTYQFNHLK